jgi:AraC-like DNA-binding protein
MDKLNLINTIGTFAVFISLLLAFFLFTVRTNNTLGNRLLACHFILVAIDLSGFFIYKYTAHFLNVEIFRWTLSLLTMPLFYLYALSMCFTNFTLRPKHLLHSIPFIINNIIFIPRFYAANTTEKLGLIEKLATTPERMGMHFLGEMQFVFYIAAIFLLLRKYKKLYQENYTNPSTANYKWLFQIVIVFLIAHSFVIVKELLQYTQYKNAFIWANVIVGTVALSVLCWFVLKALYNPALFRGIDSNLPFVKDIVPIVENNEYAALMQDEAMQQSIHAKIGQLKKYMTDKEPFLEASLSIQELATQINMPVRDVSILINHHIGQHFFDFVNEYRIKKAMEILKDPSKKDYTVQEIFYEVGFNSKSSFNTAFKKYSGQTPTDFKNNTTSTI